MTYLLPNISAIYHPSGTLFWYYTSPLWKKEISRNYHKGMDEMNTQPVESTTEPTVLDTIGTPESNGTVESQSPEVTPNATEKDEVHKQNWDNGRRRIQQRQSAKARIKQLEEELAQYKAKDDEYSKFRAGMVQDRIDDMRAMDADAEANELFDRSEQFFGEDTEQFMQDVYRYAPYVNEHEPDLLKYSNRQYGPILLHEWMKRMDQPQARQQWLGFTTFEKQKVLDNLYGQIAQIITQYNNRSAGGKGPSNVPVPNGGRQSPSSAPSDDFGVELGRSFNRHKG